LTIFSSLGTCIYTNGNKLGNFEIYSEYFNTMSFGSFIFLVFTNLFLFLQDIVMFLGLDKSTGHFFFTTNFWETTPKLNQFLFIPQAWTIGVEITFYLLAPFLVRKKLKFIFLFILFSLLLRFVLYQNGLNEDPWSYRFFPTELVFFLLGIVSYNIYVKIRIFDIRIGYLKIIWISVVFFTLFYNFLPMPFKYPIYLGLFFLCLPFIFILTKDWKYDTYIGELSYPIYISHIFVLTCMIILKIPTVFGLGFNLVIITVIFSILLNELVAKKIEKIRRNRLFLNGNK
jgi:peptidoglycan/LPS O-acetylase OafA/YrhL